MIAMASGCLRREDSVKLPNESNRVNIVIALTPFVWERYRHSALLSPNDHFNVSQLDV